MRLGHVLIKGKLGTASVGTFCEKMIESTAIKSSFLFENAMDS